MVSPASEVLDRLYAAPFDPEALPAALRAIRELVSAQSLNIRLLDVQTRAPMIVAVDGAYHSDPAITAAYFGHWMHLDSHMSAALSSRGAIVADDELVPAEKAAHDPFINEFYIPSGCGPMIGWFDAKANSATMLGSVRDRGREAFADADKRALAGLKPHVDRALRLIASATRIGMTRDDLSQLHTIEGLAFLRCSGEGRVLIASPGAEAVFAASTVVRLSHGRLIWREPENERRFARLCRAAAERSTGEDFGFVARDGEKSWLRVSAVPAPAGDAVLV
ncbi:MAG: hypothetical protein EBZ50_08850, partial [Alphaproteobacteria bacterium]|nr:hypothetical protein [Alphaproteobacteria bacterium]